MNTHPAPLTIRDTVVAGQQGRLFVRTWSPRPARDPAPIVLLHDSLGSVALWRNFPAALSHATQRTVVAYDRLGFGQSDAHPSKLALDFVGAEAQNDFAAVIQQLAIEQFVVFGHSVGGGMAVHCAAHFPHACVALVTESAQAFLEDKTVAGIEEARALFKDSAQMSRLTKYHGDKAAWVLEAWVGSWLHPSFANWSLRHALPPVKSPTLVIHGIDDEYGSPKHPQMIAEITSASAHIEIMPDTKHIPHKEKTSEVVERVRAFLDGMR